MIASKRTWCFSLFTLLLSALVVASTDASVIRLNGELVEGGDIDPFSLQFSPDGMHVLYLADQDTNEVYEAYTVPSMGGTPIKLNDSLVDDADVWSDGLQFSPDSSHVLYRADQDTDEVWEIYRVSSSGGASVKINDTLVTGGDVYHSGLQFNLDGACVLYYADQSMDGVFEIYSTTNTGNTSTKLNGRLVAEGNVSPTGLQFSPDGSRVLYLADQDTDEVWEIYSVSSTGGTPVKLNGVLASGGDVYGSSLKFNADGSRVLYRADQDTDGVFEIYSVSSTGSTPIKLNAELVPGGNVDYRGLQFDPDGSRVLYLADQDTDDMNELYIVSSFGGIPLKLNEELDVGRNVDFSGLQFSPDGSRVLYRADQAANSVYEIYSVTSTGSTPVRLNDDLTVGGDVHHDGLQFSPDGSRVVYLADQDTDEVWEIYSVSGTGGVPVKLNDELVEGGDVYSSGLQFSPDSLRVLYYADQDTDGVWEIYSVPSTGGTSVKLNAELITGGDVWPDGFQFSPDGSRILYLADQDTDEIYEIYTRVLHQQWNVASGAWDQAANWDQGNVPDEVMSISITSKNFSTVKGPTDDTEIFSLDIGGTNLGMATLEIPSEVTLTILNGTTISNRGTLSGRGHFHAAGGLVNDGRIELENMTIAGPLLHNNGVLSGGGVVSTLLNNQLSGEIRVGDSQTLYFTGIGEQTNTGRIEIIGGDLEFISELNNTNRINVVRGTFRIQDKITNAASTGFMGGEDATFHFNSGITNNGNLALSFGTSRLFGTINNDQGIITVSGASNVTFYDDLINTGTINVSMGSNAVYFGGVTGSGSFIGTGTNYFEGDLAPGSSPGTMSFGGNVVLGPSSTTEIELAGPVRGTEYDMMIVNGDLTLDGTLNILQIDGYTPNDGDVFDILDFDSFRLSGFFDRVNLPVLSSGLVWDQTNLYLTGELMVSLSQLSGDFDGDGDIDGDDFLTWQNHFPTLDGTANSFSGDANGDRNVDGDDFLIWQNHFPFFPSVFSIPEPSALVLLALCAAGISGSRRWS